ncbi:MAG: tRNA lysidine(34) synthetase TilS [Mycoplasmatales bacterium]
MSKLWLTNLNYAEKYLVAVSGGVDSVVLMDLLEKANYDYEVIHINHLTRGQENKLETDLVRKYAQTNKRKFHYFEFTNEIKGNFHSEARAFRLNCFKEVCNKNNLIAVLLGHHLDDQLENLKMFSQKLTPKLMEEKSQYNGLTIIRPLLNISKAEITTLADKTGLKYLTDSSNNDSKYFRNRIRAELSQPEQKERALVELANQKVSERKYRQIAILDTLAIAEIKLLTNDLRRLLLTKFVKSNIGEKNLSKKLIVQIETALTVPSTKLFQVTQNLQLVKGYKKLYFWDYKKPFENSEITEMYEIAKSKSKVLDLTVRQLKKGDRVIYKDYSKKVTRLFIDQKIDKNLRPVWPICVNEDDEIIFIPKLYERI